MINISPSRLSALIRNYMKDNHMSEEAFAKHSGLSLTTIKGYLAGENLATGAPSNPSMNTIYKLSDALGYTAYNLFLEDVFERPKVYYVPVINSLQDQFPERYKNVHDFEERLAVESRLCKDNGAFEKDVVETIAYRVSETNMYPYIMEDDFVVVWLQEEYADSDVIMVRPETSDNDQPLFYKVKVSGENIILYGDACCEPVIIDKEEQDAFNERVIGKVVSIRRQLA